MKNYQQIKNEILNQILESKKTSPLSNKMGYKFDKVQRWKKGSKQLNWNEFCDLCFVLKLPLIEALGFSLGALFESEKQAYKIIPFLKNFAQFKTTGQMAKQMGVSQATMQRYLSCEIYPEVEFVLECIDQKPRFLNHFLNSLLEKSEKSDLNLLSLPWASAVANAMSLPEHMSLPKYSPSWVAQRLGLTINQVMQAIQLLQDLGLIELNGEHYSPTLSRTIAVRREVRQEDYIRFLKFWMERATRRLKVDREESQFKTKSSEEFDRKSLDKDGFRVFACSPESARKIIEILMRSEQEIHDLLQKDNNEKTDVRVFLYHHFSAGEH
ncbi:MAG: DUF4423 domain-containing protein [Bdellovibrionaceae bacterium]|nr:DUF4423 domain-containing protein [Pseudobdellovibrionaceae bacterium]